MKAKSGRIPHTRYLRGAWIRLITRTGLLIMDQFMERPAHNRYIKLRYFGKVPKTAIKAMSLLLGPKPETGTWYDAGTWELR